MIAKGNQHAGFLASLSHTQWVISPQPMKTLLTTTAHTATDRGTAAWLASDIPEHFADKLSTLDNTCARAARGALKTKSAFFLSRDLNFIRPKLRFQTKIISFIARPLTKPTHHPLQAIVDQARSSKIKCHHRFFHRFFQSDISVNLGGSTRQEIVDPPTQTPAVMQL